MLQSAVVEGVPQSYDEVFDEYFPMMRSIVRKVGIVAVDSEDVAMEIFVKFMEKDGLNYYDPNYYGDADSVSEKRHRSRFKGMLRQFTSTYALQWRDKQMYRSSKNHGRIMHYQALADEDGNIESFDLFSDGEESIRTIEVTHDLTAAMLRTHARLAEMNTSKRDYHKLIERCLYYGLLDGRIVWLQVQSDLGLSATTVRRMVDDVRRVLAEEAQGYAASYAA